jgi:hypothetical protein
MYKQHHCFPRKLFASTLDQNHTTSRSDNILSLSDIRAEHGEPLSIDQIHNSLLHKDRPISGQKKKNTLIVLISTKHSSNPQKIKTKTTSQKPKNSRCSPSNPSS